MAIVVNISILLNNSEFAESIIRNYEQRNLVKLHRFWQVTYYHYGL
jgi:hypothetical protein